MKNVAAVVLAAGKGTRIGQHLPKVLYPIAGKPMIYYTLETLSKIPTKEFYVVIGFRAEDVKASIGRNTHFVYQEKQLGTAHAVKLALNELSPDIEHVLVVNGDDSAFYEPGTLRSFVASHIKENAQLSFISANRQNPSGLGRVVRDSRGDFLKVVEEKDTNDEEKRISEVNTGCYLFDVTWLRSAIDKIELSDAEEFYVTSAMQIARGQNRKVNIVTLANSNEWLGVNTKKELEVANEHMLKRLKREKTPSVFFLDVDNTILDTEGLKVTINERVVDKLHNSLGLSLPKKQIINEFWKVYEKTRDQLGYISIPNICDEFASSIGEGYIAEAMKTVFYSLPFKDHLAHGARELLEFLQPRGEAVIFGDGDLVYQPVKINNLGLKGLVDDVFVFERKTAYVPELLEIYSGHNKIVVDDQVRVLEEFKKWDKNTICIWYKYGRYAKEKPNKSSYKPDYISADLREVLSFVKKLYD